MKWARGPDTIQSQSVHLPCLLLSDMFRIIEHFSGKIKVIRFVTSMILFFLLLLDRETTTKNLSKLP